MKYCKDCVGFDECKTTGRTVEFAVDDGVCIDFDERIPMTNADRIRAMTDEELADFLAYTWATSARAWQKDTGETLHWLKQNAE